MKILIVGGTGYVGGRMAHYFREHYPDIQLFITSKRKSYPSWTNDFEIINMDVTKQDSVDACISRVCPDTIIHLGGIPQQECDPNPQRAVEVNALGTKRVIDAACQHGVTRFVYFSTFQVYGHMKGEISEQTATDPQRPYADVKLKGEEFIQIAHQSKRIKTLIFRLSNAYGYPMDTEIAQTAKGLVFNAFCRKAMEEGKIEFRSNQYRNFITLEDVTRAVEYFLLTIPEKWDSEIYNLGGESCYSIKEVAQKIADVYEKIYANPIDIVGPTDSDGDSFEPFTYIVDKLKSTGYTFLNDEVKEIQRTLEAFMPVQRKEG